MDLPYKINASQNKGEQEGIMLLDQSDTNAIKSLNINSAYQKFNPIRIIQNLWMHRELISQLTRLQILQRYKGSYLGIIWSLVTPLAMLLIYTFVFSVIFKLRWEGGITGSHAEFALTLFTGLIAFNFFSESVLAASNLIIDNPNYVKKVIFPIEILPLISIASALINALFSIFILLLGVVIIMGKLPWTLIFLPIIYFPLILLSLGLSWFLSSMGVFIRDTGHLIGVIVQMLFFLTPIFYPISAIPINFRFLLYLNPLSTIVNHCRRVILWGQLPNWGEFSIITIGALSVCFLGYIWFIKSRSIFSDVV